MIRRIPLAAFVVLASATGAQAPTRTILAIGAHAGDAELTMGPLLTAERARGTRIVILDMSLGERGNPKLSAAAYGAQKKREATDAAAAIGAELEFGPYRDAEIPNDETARRWVASVIRRIKPTLVLTHWKESMHRDHSTTSAIVRDAVLLAALPDVEGVQGQPHRGVSVWYAENWEDAAGFTPYLYVAVDTASWAKWKSAVSNFEFARGGTGYPYIEYYDALGKVRGIESRKGLAIAFNIEPEGKRRILDRLP
ncbi:MAG: PIG-L family deacetylase [Gemmatimonadaceae bacterium]|nr:PIG-L family deacetylase [Gemmatimonadaceae bacterium]